MKLLPEHSDILKFSEMFQKTFYPSIKPSDWYFEKRSEKQYIFGHSTTKTRYHGGLFFSVFVENAIAYFSPPYYQLENNTRKKMYGYFFDFMKNNHFDCLVSNGDWHPDGHIYTAVGEKSKKLQFLLDELKKHYPIYGHITLYFHTDRYLPYRFTGVFDLENETISMYNQAVSKSEPTIIIKDSKTISDFISIIEEKVQNVKTKEKDIINHVLSFDKNVYYDKNNQYFYIFNERVPFHMKIINHNGKEKFQARFQNRYYKNLNGEKLVKKIKGMFDDFMKKFRIKAAIKGSNHDFIHKLLHTIYGYHVMSYKYEKTFETSLTKSKLNELLSENISLNTIEVSKEYIEFYQMYIKSIKRRFIIQRGIQIGELFVFIASTKLFILTKDEFHNLNFTLKSKKINKEITYKKWFEQKSLA